MNRIYNVKQAAKILGLSTNTMYKYLNSGRISAARGEKKGTFRIPHKSLEKFLGTKITSDQIKQSESDQQTTPEPSIQTPSEQVAIIEVTPPSLSVKVTRSILFTCLILIIIDISINPNFSIQNLITRIFILLLFILLSYQFGGFVKK